MASIDLANPPPISGGSGELTPAVAGVAVAGDTIAGMAGVIKIGGVIRTESAEPLALTRMDGDVQDAPTPASPTYGDATYGSAVFAPAITGGAVYGKATYAQALYGVASLQKVGGLTRTDTAAPLALTRTPGPDL